MSSPPLYTSLFIFRAEMTSCFHREPRDSSVPVPAEGHLHTLFRGSLALRLREWLCGIFYKIKAQKQGATVKKRCIFITQDENC